MFGYIHTAKGITVIHQGRSVTVSVEDVRYPKIIDIINRRDAGEFVFDDEIDSALATPKVQIEKAIAAQSLSTKISVTDTAVLYNGKPVNNTLTVRMLEFLKQGVGIAPMVPFLENLLQNPSYRAVQDLYSFLEKGGIPLTSDGHFLAYKYVRDDYKDCYSGTYDNSVGQVVEMPRNEVDENPSRTCSNGLHVCSYEYLPKTPHGQRIVIVKVNPKDVVAIPADYNDTKMRVCRYEVVGELDITDGVKNTLSETLVNTDYDGGSEPFPDEVDKPFTATLYGAYGGRLYSESFAFWEDALEYAEAELDSTSPKIVVEGPGKTVTYEL